MCCLVFVVCCCEFVDDCSVMCGALFVVRCLLRVVIVCCVLRVVYCCLLLFVSLVIV